MNTQNEQLEATGQNNKKRHALGAYGAFAVGVVPLYTLAFACQGDLITSNLSQLGNRPGYHGRFIFWGILCGVFFYILFNRVFAMAQYNGWIGRVLLAGACTSFLVCVLLPFVPEKYPRAAKWHNDLAMLASVLTALTTLILSLHLRRVDGRPGSWATKLWLINTGLCIYLLQTTGISGLLEVVFIATTCLHVYGVMVRLGKAEASEGEALPEAA